MIEGPQASITPMAPSPSKKPETKPETIVTFCCPRCNGAGQRAEWCPDNGICYLCKGKKLISVNIERGERHLSVLRKEYAAARRARNEPLMADIAKRGIWKAALVAEAKAMAVKLG